MANFCEKCGTPLAAGAKFCTKCGNVVGGNFNIQPVQRPVPQQVNQVQPVVNPKSNKKVIIAVVAVVLAALIAVGGFFIFKGLSDKPGKGDKEAVEIEREEVTNKKEDKDGTTVSKPQSDDRIIVSTGGTTGTYYAFTNAVCNQLSVDGKAFTVVSSGGSQANIESISDGESQMAIVQNDIMNYAYMGENDFEAPIRDFSAIGCMYPEVCQLVARADSDIASVEDLKGKTVAIGDVGSGVYYNATQILAAAGIDIDKDINKVAASFGDSADQLKDGKIDAAFITAGTPTTAVTDLAVTTDIVVVEIDDRIIRDLIAENSFYQKYTLTSDDYSFITEPVDTVCVYSTFIVSDNLSEEVVYEITKSIWENTDEIAAVHAKGEELDIYTTLNGLGNVPLHPGAERYYREKGIEKPAVDAPSEQNPAVEENSGVEIPDVSYNSMIEGEMKLKLLNLDVHLVPEFDDSVEPGTILRIEPESGAYVPVGSVVTIYYSTNVKLETVPNVLNMMIEPATQALEGLGFEVVIEQLDNKRPKGTVIGQSIIGEEVERGTVIILSVSTGVDPGE